MRVFTICNSCFVICQKLIIFLVRIFYNFRNLLKIRYFSVRILRTIHDSNFIIKLVLDYACIRDLQFAIRNNL